MEPTQEHWRPVVGFNGHYEVSNQGRVRSVARVITTRDGRKQRWPSRNRALKVDSSGYFSVGLQQNGKTCTYRVHRLVAAAFIGPCPPRLEVCHNDGNPLNNSAANLRYDTHVANVADRAQHAALRGDLAPRALLTPEQVIEIRRRHSAGQTRQQIADFYEISKHTVKSIVLRRNWKHVP